MVDQVLIKGTHKGYKRGASFELTNGRIWEQTSHEYQYHYSYRSEALIDTWGSRGRIKIDGMSDWVEVKKIK